MTNDGIDTTSQGYAFYGSQSPGWIVNFLKNNFGITLKVCGRKTVQMCYYVEGVEGDDRYEKAIDLAADLVTRFGDIRSFAMPTPKAQWPGRLLELRKGLKDAKDHRDSVIVYEGCAAQERMTTVPPCYNYIGNLEDFASYIQDTHNYDWEKGKKTGIGSRFGRA